MTMTTPYWPRHLPRQVSIPRTSLHHNLEVSATRFPDKTAIWFYGREVTYAELYEQSARLSGHLQRQGVRKGDRVLVWLQNSPQFVIACHAIWRSGAAVVPLSPMLLAQELQFFLHDAGIQVGVVGAELYEKARAANLGHAIVASYGAGVSNSPVPVNEAFAVPETAQGSDVTWAQALSGDVGEVAAVAGDDLAIMPYTSGTTGRPKGCMHTHSTVQANVMTSSYWVHHTNEDVVLGSLPFFHVTGCINSMLGPVYGGSRMVIMNRWDREVARHLIREQQCSIWTNTPTMLVDLLATPGLVAEDLKSLQNVSGGGAALPAAVGERFEQLTGLRFLEGYGLTETMAQSHSNPPGHGKLQCLGIPVFGTEARVVNPETLEEVPVGESGEILIHGPQVMAGYWQRPEGNAEAFVELDGKRFFRSGDLGRVDEEGFFFFVDRLKRMINASGMKVWPAEVESILYRHPAVQEAVVISAPDAHRGETVKAMIVLREGQREQVTPEDVISWAREQMATYKVPRLVEFVDSLPRGGTGKINWRLLQEQERAKHQQVTAT